MSYSKLLKFARLVASDACDTCDDPDEPYGGEPDTYWCLGCKAKKLLRQISEDGDDED